VKARSRAWRRSRRMPQSRYVAWRTAGGRGAGG
jgi:hypothetical protein